MARHQARKEWNVYNMAGFKRMLHIFMFLSGILKARCHQELQLVGQVDGHALSRDNWTDEYSYQARQSRQAVGRAHQCNRTIPRQSNAYPYGYVYMFYAFVHAARVFRRPARDLRRHPDIGPDRRDVGQ
jgi:hypothetical protein